MNFDLPKPIIPKHNFKELEKYIDNMEGTSIPVFGFPAMDYSIDSNVKSWSLLSSTIFNTRKRFKYLVEIIGNQQASEFNE